MRIDILLLNRFSISIYVCQAVVVLHHILVDVTIPSHYWCQDTLNDRQCSRGVSHLHLLLDSEKNEDLDLNLYATQQRVALLADVFQCNVTVAISD
jgi:hypothetical protein